ncbi:MAG: extracellular solute-binding protein [Clostridia bacterium]|nr:extracellular solute-binding protein [Clostridia bacterium]
MSKKFIKCSAAILAAAAMVTGCGLNSTSPTSSGDNEKVTVTFSFWEPSTNRELETILSKFADEYSEKHSNVKIKLMSQPNSGYQEWIQSQFVSDNAPDIQYNQPANLNNQVESGFLVDISEYLNQPNPYNSTGKAWRDDFTAGKVSAAQSFRGENHAIPLSGLGLAFYYNADVYEKLGLKVPKTWDEMIANFKVIQENNIAPVAFMGQKRDAVDWISWQIATGLFSEELLSDPKLNFNGDNNLDNYEIFRAVDEGYYDITVPGKFQDHYKKYLSYLEEYGKYCPNLTGLDEAGAKAQFLSGKAGHIFSGSWDLQGFTTDEKLPFKVGVFPFPKFTKENTEKPGDNMAIVDVTAVAVTNHATKNPKVLEAAVDFLRYITSTEKYAEFVEATYAIPVMDGLDVDESFIAFQGGSRAPLGIYSIGSSKAEFSNYNANISVLAGENLGYDYLASNALNAIKMSIKAKKEKDPGFGKDNNYLIDTLPKILGDFEPYLAE